jgi:hypothetical protein
MVPLFSARAWIDDSIGDDESIGELFRYCLKRIRTNFAVSSRNARTRVEATAHRIEIVRRGRIVPLSEPLSPEVRVGRNGTVEIFSNGVPRPPDDGSPAGARRPQRETRTHS